MEARISSAVNKKFQNPDFWRKLLTFLIVIGLVGFAIATRLIPHPPNFTSVASVAIFAGALLPRRWALVVPALTMIASDAVVGFHSLVLVTWGSMILATVIGRHVMKTITFSRTVFASFAASFSFFAITNFAVWSEGLMYPMNLSGLLQCYYNAIPFFRNSLAGDLFYSSLIFVLYATVRMLATSKLEKRVTV